MEEEKKDAKHIVYIHTNIINNKKYVGQTKKKFKCRCGRNGQGYLHTNPDGSYAQPAFARAIVKYGWENFEHEIVAENLTKEEANEMEIALIAELNTTDPEFGYNITKGGNSISDTVHSEEYRKKASERMKNVVMDDEWKLHISQSKMGHEVPQETRDKISNSLVGRFCGENHPNYGKKHKPESIQKMREVHTGQLMAEKNGNTVFVVCEETGVIYAGQHEAERLTGVPFKNISAALHRNKTRKAGGYHWRYATPEEIQQEKERREKENE